jgi:hypothetical protein
MKEPEIRELVKKRLVPFMKTFDNENRGNRLSMDLAQGLGRRLEDLIVDIIIKEQCKDVPARGDD